MDKSIRVVIVDDHTIVREGLKKMLAAEERIEVIGEAANGKEGVRLIGKLKPDIAVLDISMPEMGGLEVLSAAREIAPKTRIVILSMHGKESLAQEALRAGASAYILKGDSGEELISAIFAAHKGDYYFSAQLRAALVSSYIGKPECGLNEDEARYRELSDRERQYFRMMLTGNSTQEISRTLGISYKTGQKHRANVIRKLGANNPMEMVKLALRLGLLDPGSAENP